MIDCVPTVAVVIICTHLFCRAYWGFADHFKDAADQLLNSLDGTHRRMLQANGAGAAGGGGEVSNSSSSNSLQNAGRGSAAAVATAAPRQSRLPSSRTNSQENLEHHPQERRGSNTLTRKSSGIPFYTSPLKATGNGCRLLLVVCASWVYKWS